jgi:replicative DNA helicase
VRSASAREAFSPFFISRDDIAGVLGIAGGGDTSIVTASLRRFAGAKRATPFSRKESKSSMASRAASPAKIARSSRHSDRLADKHQRRCSRRTSDFSSNMLRINDSLFHA